MEKPEEFSPDDDDRIGINEEGQYNMIFDLDLRPSDVKTPVMEDPINEQPMKEVPINEVDEHDNSNPRFPHFVHDNENPVIALKATFENKRAFVLALRQNVIMEEYDFHI